MEETRLRHCALSKVSGLGGYKDVFIGLGDHNGNWSAERFEIPTASASVSPPPGGRVAALLKAGQRLHLGLAFCQVFNSEFCFQPESNSGP